MWTVACSQCSARESTELLASNRKEGRPYGALQELDSHCPRKHYQQQKLTTTRSAANLVEVRRCFVKVGDCIDRLFSDKLPHRVHISRLQCFQLATRDRGAALL
jgi:hypothetical protein